MQGRRLVIEFSRGLSLWENPAPTCFVCEGPADEWIDGTGAGHGMIRLNEGACFPICERCFSDREAPTAIARTFFRSPELAVKAEWSTPMPSASMTRQ